MLRSDVKFLKNSMLLENSQDRVLRILRHVFLKKTFDYWSHHVSALLHRYKDVAVATDCFNWDSARLVELCSTICQCYTQETKGKPEVTSELSLEAQSRRYKAVLQLLHSC